MVQEELETAGAGKDKEMLDLVNQLIEALKETPEGQKAIGKYNLNIQNSNEAKLHGKYPLFKKFTNRGMGGQRPH